jgi:hypothetical protein
MTCTSCEFIRISELAGFINRNSENLQRTHTQKELVYFKVRQQYIPLVILFLYGRRHLGQKKSECFHTVASEALIR